jgi:hypothetical protein
MAINNTYRHDGCFLLSGQKGLFTSENKTKNTGQWAGFPVIKAVEE